MLDKIAADQCRASGTAWDWAGRIIARAQNTSACPRTATMADGDLAHDATLEKIGFVWI